MTTEPVADWAAARSDKWRRHLAGLEAMLKPIDAPLVAALDLGGPCRIADVGCGGGATALEVGRVAPAGSVVHGFDVSPALIEVARGRAAGSAAAVRFDVADMAVATPPGSSYDRLMSRLGVMFFKDAAPAFANLRQWLLPGGRCAFAVWGPVADNPWMAVTRDVIGRFVSLPAIAPEVPGPFRYGDGASLVTLLGTAGFDDVSASDCRLTLAMGGGLAASHAADFAIASFSSFAELLADAGGDTPASARQALTERFANYEQDGIVRFEARLHIVRGEAAGG